MHSLPIEELRHRLTSVATRRGISSPSTLRVSQFLDRFVNEWYRAASPGTLAAQVLQQPRVKDRQELVARIADGVKRSDAARLTALLPLVMDLPKDDPDRAELLFRCAVTSWSPGRCVTFGPTGLALEESAATAVPFSLLHLRTLSALAGYYLQVGRLHAAYYLSRWVLRHLHRFPDDPMLHAANYFSFGAAARRRGKALLAHRAMWQTLQYPAFVREWGDAIHSELFNLAARTDELTALQAQLRAIYPDSRYQPQLLVGYAGALLRHHRPKAAIAVATRAVSRIGREQAGEPLTLAELYLILASASETLGRHAPAQAFIARARQILGPQEHQVIARRMQEWQLAAMVLMSKR